jgi:hypothetical protein
MLLMRDPSKKVVTLMEFLMALSHAIPICSARCRCRTKAWNIVAVGRTNSIRGCHCTDFCPTANVACTAVALTGARCTAIAQAIVASENRQAAAIKALIIRTTRWAAIATRPSRARPNATLSFARAGSCTCQAHCIRGALVSRSASTSGARLAHAVRIDEAALALLPPKATRIARSSGRTSKLRIAATAGARGGVACRQWCTRAVHAGVVRRTKLACGTAHTARN